LRFATTAPIPSRKASGSRQRGSRR
jgi:hypothetical protein